MGSPELAGEGSRSNPNWPDYLGEPGCWLEKVQTELDAFRDLATTLHAMQHGLQPSSRISPFQNSIKIFDSRPSGFKTTCQSARPSNICWRLKKSFLDKRLSSSLRSITSPAIGQSGGPSCGPDADLFEQDRSSFAI
ncbi:hypothetical protein B0T17DRAFT_543446 [Bombardia bombarda]|uniref:Uncharacterized protein n=1 Tax=Bombardia bombarda TaxID=252184 RepID=A0AA39TI85_9PEZI|nr:hypothetical protein B0T17DRAFT_543446 [Bombardia bombarda]